MPPVTVETLPAPPDGSRVRVSTAASGLTGLLVLMFGAFIGLGLMDGAGGVLWADVIDAFGVSKGVFGLLSGFGLAVSFPILLFGGRLTERFDKRSLLAVSFLGMGVACLGLLTGAGGIVVFAVSLTLRASSITLLDLSNNALAMDYEQATDRRIMSPLHAGFSGGTMLGAGIVWVALAAGGGFGVVYLGLAIVFVLAVAGTVQVRRTLRLPYLRSTEREAPAVALSLLRRRDVRWFAAITGLAFGGEALISQWAGIYLRDERGFSARIGVFAIAAYGLAMFVGRLSNGPLIARLGDRGAILVQGGTTLLGGVLIASGGPAAIAVLGCGIAGLGLAGTGPTALSMAGAAVPSATGAASGATLAGGYLGFAGAPALAGIVASLFSARVVMGGVALAGLLVVVMALRVPEPKA
jgi:predicted MFS family arabinose efflux permease